MRRSRSIVQLVNCRPTPVKAGVHRKSNVKPERTISWRTQEKQVVYTLDIPGGIFIGHDTDFQVTVTADGPSEEYEVRDDAALGEYEYGIHRQPPCKKSRLDPPTIIVQD